MKKVKVLGKMIPVFVLVLLGIGMVSAALVGYLSNKVEADVTVESPIEQLISDGGDYGLGPITLTTLQGGESATIWVKTHNKADIAITGNVNNTVTNLAGLTCADFSDVEARTNSGLGYSIWWNITSLCSSVDLDHVRFNYGPNALTDNSVTWAAGQIDTTQIKVTFKTNALGTYTFTSEVVPV